MPRHLDSLLETRSARFRTLLLAAGIFATSSSSEWARTARGDFSPPETVATGQDALADYDLGVDAFGLVRVVYEQDGALWLATRGIGAEAPALVSLSGAAPSIAFYPLGFTAVWAEANEHRGGDIRLRTRTGPAFGEAVTVATRARDRELRRPFASADARGQVSIVWEESLDGGASTQVWVRVPQGTPQSLGLGAFPRVELDRLGRTRVVFVRAGRLWTATDADSRIRGIFSRPREVAPLRRVDAAPATAMLDGRDLFIAFESEGSVYIADDRLGSFDVRRLSDAASAPDIAITSSGLIALAFVREGDIWFSLGNAFFFADPQRLARSAEEETAPRVAADTFGNVVITFVRQGEILLTTNATPAQARFEASPERGEAPLLVRFTDSSIGDATAWSWDFGDGGTSSERHPEHIFEATGEYRVRLTVSGPGGTSLLTHESVVLATDPGHVLWPESVRVFAGQRGVHVPILSTHRSSLQGFQIAATFDARSLIARNVEFAKTNIGSFEPELRLFSISNEPDDPWVNAGVLFDIEPPFDQRVLPPGSGLRLAGLVFDIDPDARAGVRAHVTLVNGVGRPALNNVHVSGSRSIVPVLGEPAHVEIARLVFPPPAFFVRGDFDGSRAVTITDAIATLAHLFTGGPPPQCFDAADASDDGKVDITDPLYVLNFLFRSGGFPLPPYPDPGLDPTADEIPDCGL
jgi:PKD repeat protein